MMSVSSTHAGTSTLFRCCSRNHQKEPAGAVPAGSESCDCTSCLMGKALPRPIDSPQSTAVDALRTVHRDWRQRWWFESTLVHLPAEPARCLFLHFFARSAIA